LHDAIWRLTDELRVLRESVDDLREDVQWLCNSAADLQFSESRPYVVQQSAAAPTPDKVVGQPTAITRGVQDVRHGLNAILAGDCITGMQELPDGIVDLVFADPPFNIDYEYDQYDDSRSPAEYLEWTRRWTTEAIRVLKPTGAMWVAIGDEYAAEVKTILQQQRLVCRNWVIWYYTFGVNCRTKFSRSHAHLLYMVRNGRDFTFNDGDIRVRSARQLEGDERAGPGGRVPDDTWILRPQALPEAFQPDEDTWHVRRVNGTFRERQGWHTCQMPEQILARIIRTCSNARDIVLDPFTGSGTTPAVAKKLGRQFIGFELSEDYASRARDRVDGVSEGDAIAGTDEPFVRESSRRASRRSDPRQQDLW
jgi:site-specific DNA-methyltransferase (adenine-specific)